LFQKIKQPSRRRIRTVRQVLRGALNRGIGGRIHQGIC
jgi:hypothetical protein